MTKVIRINSQVFERLQKYAVPLVDTPASVIEKLLDFHDAQSGIGKPSNLNNTRKEREPNPDTFLKDRVSRERGITIKIGDYAIKADSVSDMYSQVLQFLYEKKYLKNLEIPLKTGTKRYLISKYPVHPSKKDFVIPVEFKGFYMEAHKSYDTAINDLRKMLNLCSLTLEVVK